MSVNDNFRAVVTGVGIYSPIGNSSKSYLNSLRTERSGIAPVKAFDASTFRGNLVGEVTEFDLGKDVGTDVPDDFDDRALHLAMAAALQAVRQAGLDTRFGYDRRIALSIGSCNGTLRTAEVLYQRLIADPTTVVSAKTVERLRFAAFSRALVSLLEIGGPTAVTTTACSSSTGALALALDWIQAGEADIVLAGGADALCLTNMSGFNGLKAMAGPGHCHPFSGDVRSAGMTLAEGAGIWVVESKRHANSRNAVILGEILGAELTGDAHHLTSPDPRGNGGWRAMMGASERAGIDLNEIGYVNAHGTGTEANDRAETRALQKLVEQVGHSVPVSSTKSFFGHAMGAAGILEASATLLSLREGFLPPTINFGEPRPGFDLDFIPNTARPTSAKVAITNNFAFGGNNASVVLTTDLQHPGPRKTVDKRVVITGYGAVSPAGIGVDSLVAFVYSGISAISRVTRFNVAGCSCTRAGLLDPFDWRPHARRLDMRSMNDISRFATLAAVESIENAELSLNPNNLNSTGLVLGTYTAAPPDNLMYRVWSSPERLPDLAAFAESVPNSINGAVSIALYLKGYNTMLATGRQVGVGAMIEASRAIALGHGSRIVTGSIDYVGETDFVAMDRAGMLTPDAGAIGDSGRIIGEGSAMLVLEDFDSAKARGATIRAYVLAHAEATRSRNGGATGNVPTAEDAVTWTMKTALERANIAPAQIGRLFAGDKLDYKFNDIGRAVVTVFGDVLPQIISTTAITGYLSAGSALMAFAAHLADPNREPGTVMILGTCADGPTYAVIAEVA